jgi:hypothetical protein
MNGKFEVIVEIKDNFLRLNRHKIEPVVCDAIRITIHRTHGDPLARIFEVRCYA